MRPAVLVTGASTGIGAATAKLLARNGYDVGIGYRSGREAAEAVAAEAEAAGARAVLLQGDLGQPGDVEKVMSDWDAAFGRMDALVNNAGIVVPPARIDEMDAARIEGLLAINVTGAFLVAGAAVRRMSTRHGGKGGSIVNMSSVAAKIYSPGVWVDYAASKAAIDVLTKGLALEVAAEGVRVNAIRPGLIETPIHGKGGDADRARKLAPQVPMQRVGQPEEIAEAALWLLSDRASYVTGTIVDVSGGR
jgi:NAD(P)-dependent dehydrogenase (short-subunit alcohol dehydrogenase family)